MKMIITEEDGLKTEWTKNKNYLMSYLELLQREANRNRIIISLPLIIKPD